MSEVNKMKLSWTSRFILLCLLLAAFHYFILLLASGSLLDISGDKSNFFTAVVLPLIVWMLSMPAQALMSGPLQHAAPGTLAIIWVLNSLAWGLFLAALVVWIWRMREPPLENHS
jgi:hypothetical protein